MLNDSDLIHASFDLWIGEKGESNRAELDRVKKILPMVLEVCCTEIQMKYMMHYFADGMAIGQIAKLYGVSKPTVSKTIHRGINKAYSYLRFCSPLFIKAPQKRSYLKRNVKNGGAA